MLEVDIKKRLGGLELVYDFACETQGIVAVFGRSGAGKTGRIAVAGRTLFDTADRTDVPPERRRLGYVAPKAERRIGLDEMVALLGIEGLMARRPGDLSGGEKQRVSLGRALLANPRLLLMDEPLANLDQPRKDEVLPFIERLRDELAIPMVYVSHAMEEIVRLADTMVLISDGRAGRAVAVGPVEDLTSRLDLRPLTGRYEAGSVLEAQVRGHDKTFGLTRLAFAGGQLMVPHVALPLGTNIFPARVKDLARDQGPLVDVLLDAGGAPLWARVTARACQALTLEPGRQVYALVKAVAVDRHSLGRHGAAREPQERFPAETLAATTRDAETSRSSDEV
jgi:molybdate transport system ATP-binding protein